MQMLLAAVTSKKGNSRNAPGTSLPSPVVSAAQLLRNVPAGLIASVTVSQPVSSRKEAEAIGSVADGIAIDHQLAVEIAINDRRVRLRFSRLTGLRKEPDGEN